MLSVKQGGIKYHFLSLCYDSTWDWIPVSRAIGEHSTTKPMGVFLIFYMLAVPILKPEKQLLNMEIVEECFGEFFVF